MSERNIKILNYIIVSILAVTIGLFLALQIKTTAQSGDYKGGMISIAQAQSSAAELAAVKAQREELLQELNNLETKMKEIQENEAKDNSTLQSKLDDLEKYRMATGVTDVSGTGIIVTIDDPEAKPGFSNDSVITYNYELLLVLVNKLREAGAEAISINDKRITAFSEISLAGNNININSSPTAPPYEVKAIGNPDTLESTLSIRYGILYSMKNDYGLSVSTKQAEDITILRYSGVLTFKYAKTAE